MLIPYMFILRMFTGNQSPMNHHISGLNLHKSTASWCIMAPTLAAKSRLQQLLAMLLGQRPILRRKEHWGAQVALLQDRWAAGGLPELRIFSYTKHIVLYKNLRDPGPQAFGLLTNSRAV